MDNCESELSLWYLDDATVGGDPDTVLQDLAKIEEASNSLGLSLKPSKCELYFRQMKNLHLLKAFSHLTVPLGIAMSLVPRF